MLMMMIMLMIFMMMMIYYFPCNQSSLDVSLMPGEYDPSNHVQPQQPMHRCMFPQSARHTTFSAVTNPHDASVDGIR